MPKASEWMINLSLFTVRDFCIAEFACVLQDWNRYIWGICWVNTSCCWASHALSLYGARLMLAQLESLHYLFSNEELNMQVCVCLFHMSLNCCSISQVSFSIPCVTFFSLVKRSLSQNTLLLYFSVPLNISRCSNANMELWTPGTFEQRGAVLSAFMAEGNVLSSFCYIAIQPVYLLISLFHRIYTHSHSNIHPPIWVHFTCWHAGLLFWL